MLYSDGEDTNNVADKSIWNVAKLKTAKKNGIAVGDRKWMKLAQVVSNGEYFRFRCCNLCYCYQI
jgi:hypothetical protein